MRTSEIPGCANRRFDEKHGALRIPKKSESPVPVFPRMYLSRSSMRMYIASRRVGCAHVTVQHVNHGFCNPSALRNSGTVKQHCSGTSDAASMPLEKGTLGAVSPAAGCPAFGPAEPCPRVERGREGLAARSDLTVHRPGDLPAGRCECGQLRKATIAAVAADGRTLRKFSMLADELSAH
eukprot:COSAG02_NODE_1614_length_11668_cov_77.958078_5_plen_180_part_00